MQNFVKTYNFATPDLRYQISLAKIRFFQVKSSILLEKLRLQTENLTEIFDRNSEKSVRKYFHRSFSAENFRN